MKTADAPPVIPARPVTLYLYRLLIMARVGRWLLAVAGLGAMLCGWAGKKACLWFLSGMPPGSGPVWAQVAFWAGLLVVMALLDARSRFQDYKRARDLFFENGPHPRIVRLFAHSKCQRDAALWAARDLGMAKNLKGLYRVWGYRWYHLLPDAVFSHPGLLLSRRYWCRTLFTPFYAASHFSW